MNSNDLIERLRCPRERTAYGYIIACSVVGAVVVLALIVSSMGGLLLLVGLGPLIAYMVELMALAHFKTSGVMVSANQFPELNSAIDRCCAALGGRRPTVYVVQQNMFNAFAARMAGQEIVILYSTVVDMIMTCGDMDQVMFIVAHELGHHYAGHLSRSHRLVVTLGGGILFLTLWYKRMAELTCDRVGMYCVGNLNSSLLGLCNLTVGARLAPAVNVGSAIAQWEQHRHEFWVRRTMLYMSHPPHLERIAELVKSAGEFSIPPDRPEPSIQFVEPESAAHRQIDAVP